MSCHFLGRDNICDDTNASCLHIGDIKQQIACETLTDAEQEQRAKPRENIRFADNGQADQDLAEFYRQRSIPLPTELQMPAP